MNQRKQLLVEIQVTHNLLLQQKNEVLHHKQCLKTFIYNYRYVLTLASIVVVLTTKKIGKTIPSLIAKCWEIGLLVSKLI